MLAGGVGVVEARSQGEWRVANNLYVGGGETGPGGEGFLKTSDDGRISVGNELHLFDQGSVDVMGGRINVGQGDLPAIGTLRVGQSGTLSGTGEILGDVLVDGGTLIPGDSPGVLSISGDLDQAAGLLEFEIGGPMAGLDHDQLVVGGVASLRSVVRFEFIDGFTPSPGQLFQMVAAGDGVNSQFALYDFTGISDQLQLSAVVADGVLSFLDAPLIGDTNHDGTVGLNDLNNVRNNFGLEGAPMLGDTNLDGRVDLQDLNNVRNNFGTSALQAVPEPAGWQLAGMLMVIALGSGRLYGARVRRNCV